MLSLHIPTAPLTRAAFAPFGDVVETEGAENFRYNDGYAVRFHDLARIECAAEGGRPLLSIFRAKPFPMPLRIALMERHPLSSQAFVPMGEAAFLVLVAEKSAKPVPGDLRAFVTNGRQGVNYRPGTWHHPLIALKEGDFLVIDRSGPGPGFTQDYDEVRFEDSEVTVSP
ncbi:MAG: ureidoglycolate lyase [Alphaproteobacteria bacterium]